MSKKKKKLPWTEDQYVILEDRKEIWLRGSFMRAMYLKSAQKEKEICPGYSVKLACQDFIDRLKADPSVRNTIQTDEKD